MEIILANPRGFCAGVDRAIQTVDRALELFGTPLYVRHEIVHNRTVVDDFTARGVVFIDDLSQVPEGSNVIFSAHGVSQQVEDIARKRSLNVVDATCPLVSKVHAEAVRYHRGGKHVVLIGHKGHVEVEGTLGRIPTEAATLVQTVEDAQNLSLSDPENVALLTQTTLSVDETAAIVATLKQRFPSLTTPTQADICYATQNRQDAIKALADRCDVVLVVGSTTSSNSNRLVDVAKAKGTPAYLIDSAEHLTSHMTENAHTVGLSAGASAPEALVQKVVQALGAEKVTTLDGTVEDMTFSLPTQVRIV